MRALAVSVVAAIGFLGAAVGQTIHLEAENGKLEGPTLKAERPDPPVAGGAPQRTGFSGAGYVTGFQQDGDRLVLKFKVKKAGLYVLKVGYASDTPKGFTLEVNEGKVSGTFPATGGGRFAEIVAGKVELPQGPNVIAVDRGWGWFDIDYVELTMAPPPPPVLRPLAQLTDFKGSDAAVALLNTIDDQYGKLTMLGVYNEKDAQYVADTVGARPAIMGGDFIDYAQTPLKYGTNPHETERMLDAAKAGYTLTMSWHWRPPLGIIDKVGPNGEDQRWWASFYTRATTFDLTIAMNDATSPERAGLVKDIDLIAAQLKRLDEAGVPVLWRPLHEAQGGWFWWGAKGPKPFIWLWRFLYNRLVNEDGVHNLVWVFTSGNDSAWYPGDAFVDVVGIDEYPEDIKDPESGLWDLLNQQYAGRKPLAIAEFGGVPDVPKMQRLGEWWAYAVSWQDQLGPKKNTVDELKRIYAGDGVGKLPLTPSPSPAPPPPPPPVE